MTEQNFIQECKKIGIEISQEQIAQFKRYMELLLEWNEKMNLTAITDESEIWEKHFFDSILPFVNCEFKTVCDVGSGAGFPGIPLKIVKPDIEITLVEPLQKRCKFLNEVVNVLGLENVYIENKRAEDFVKEKREYFDCVSARAVARLSILSELCMPLVKLNGIMIALKGKNGHEEWEIAKIAVSVLGMELEREEVDSLENQATRVNLYFRKVKHTPLKYPRAYGQIKKKPLGE